MCEASSVPKQPMVWDPRLLASFFLVLLVLQNVGQAVTTRASRLHAGDGPEWIGTTSVVCSECVKLLASIALVAVDNKEEGMVKTVKRLFFSNIRTCLLMGVPGLLYTVQNNLYIVGLSNLSVSMFQVLSQCKILTTAVFSITILGKELGPVKWTGLCMLTCGVILIVAKGDTATKGDALVGCIAVACGCCTSGVAGVFIEKMLKDSSATIWERNVQLSAFGVIFAMFAVLTNDKRKVMEGGFFQGYNYVVVAVVLQQALGGLVVAAVLKYADNLLKCFAVAFSVIIGSVISRLAYGEGPALYDPTFVFGSFIVIVSITIYSLPKETVLEALNTIFAHPSDKMTLSPSCIGQPAYEMVSAVCPDEDESDYEAQSQSLNDCRSSSKSTASGFLNVCASP